jgi:undecaprenyl-diphosphatase
MLDLTSAFELTPQKRNTVPRRPASIAGLDGGFTLSLFLFVLSALFAASSCSLQAQWHTGPNSLDVRLFRSINDARSRTATAVFNITDYSVWPVLIATPLTLMGTGIGTGDEETFESGMLLSAAEGLAYGVRGALKIAFKRPRPYEELQNVSVGHLETSDPYSFPSGHTTGVFTMAMLLSLRYPKPAVMVPAIAYAGIVAYGRIYYGLHYPSDIAGGILVGAGSAMLAYMYRDELMQLSKSILGKRVFAIVVPTESGAAGYMRILL